MRSTTDIRRPVVAVAAVIVENGKLLLIKRGVEPSKGKWSIPGGSVEWGEPLVEAVRREVREETGLEIEVGEVAGVFELIIEPPDANHTTLNAYHYVIIDYFARPIGGTLAPGDDAAEALWVPIGELDKYELTEHLSERLREMGVK
jgi:ADP-ribose pyrophosphatase YjhB (NUDIX family)